jgi:hypothetical protein
MGDGQDDINGDSCVGRPYFIMDLYQAYLNASANASNIQMYNQQNT